MNDSEWLKVTERKLVAAKLLGNSLYVDALETVIKFNEHVKPALEEVANQSVWKTMKSYGRDKMPFALKDIVMLLLSANVYGDIKHAKRTVDSLVCSHKNEVQRISRGIYKFKET